MVRTLLLVSLVMACGKKESADDEFRRLATAARPPIAALAKFHADILPKDKKVEDGLIWIKAAVDACIASRDETEKLARMTFDPPLSEEKLSGEVLTGAASSHLLALDYNCKEPGMRESGDVIAAMAKCHRACMASWTRLVESVELLRRQGANHGIELASLAP
jgi:hypothetical protein